MMPTWIFDRNDKIIDKIMSITWPNQGSKTYKRLTKFCQVSVIKTTYSLVVPDTVNFSRPRVGRRVTRARAQNLSTIHEEVQVEVERPAQPPVSTGIDIGRVTAVEETRVNEKLWHIAQLNKVFAKACWAQMVVTRKKCISCIVQNGKSTPAPTYIGLWTHPQKDNQKVVEQFFFCVDDIERCVKGYRRRWIEPFSDYEERPPIPSVWPVKIRTISHVPRLRRWRMRDFNFPKSKAFLWAARSTVQHCHRICHKFQCQIMRTFIQKHESQRTCAAQSLVPVRSTCRTLIPLEQWRQVFWR